MLVAVNVGHPLIWLIGMLVAANVGHPLIRLIGMLVAVNAGHPLIRLIGMLVAVSDSVRQWVWFVKKGEDYTRVYFLRDSFDPTAFSSRR